MDEEEVKVLLVDDDDDMLESLRTLLELDGYSVRTVRDAASALGTVESFRPHCVLLDIGLPRVDGCELARQLRTLHGADLVLVAVTGHTREEDRLRAEAAGIDFVMTKPVDTAVLRTILPPLR